jgi:hypothetical protein
LGDEQKSETPILEQPRKFDDAFHEQAPGVTIIPVMTELPPPKPTRTAGGGREKIIPIKLVDRNDLDKKLLDERLAQISLMDSRVPLWAAVAGYHVERVDAAAQRVGSKVAPHVDDVNVQQANHNNTLAQEASRNVTAAGPRLQELYERLCHEEGKQKPETIFEIEETNEGNDFWLLHDMG